jgi:hypothetical protein
MRYAGMICFFALLLSASPIQAQARSTADAGVADTTVVRLLSPGLIRGLDDSIARLLFDSTAEPWTISVPDSTSAAWRALASGLSSLLHARAIAHGDSVQNFLDIAPVSMNNDTLVAHFSVGLRWRCPAGEWAAGSTHYELTAVRHGTSWEYPQTRTVLYGDGACLVPLRSPA